VTIDLQQFEDRKRDHIRYALDQANQASGQSGLESVHLVHEALPDLDFEELSLASVCLGRPAPTPFYIAGMTAGHADAAHLNLMMARACQTRGWAMGVGSQRRELEATSTDKWKELRETAPDVVLVANLGISQLIRTPLAQIERVVAGLRADALAIHLNALQEVMQPEGTPHFKGSLSAVRRICAELSIPVVLKETGCGFSARTLARLREAGFAAVDVSGLGGTHWGRIEGARAAPRSIQAQAAQTYAGWGETTVDSVRAAREALPGMEIWASGGVRSGLDAAKLIALGAQRVGYAKPALEAALAGEVALDAWMAQQEYELKTALFCTGSATPAELARGAHAVIGAGPR
jgi:isopentenyl-diphosphate delta-isomerase